MSKTFDLGNQMTTNLQKMSHTFDLGMKMAKILRESLKLLILARK